MAAQLPNTLKGFTFFANGTSFAGRGDIIKHPITSFGTEEVRGGGLGGTMDVLNGELEKMPFEFSIQGYDAVLSAQMGLPDASFTARGNISTPEGDKALVLVTRGLFKTTEMADFQAGQTGMTKVLGTASYYRAVLDGRELWELDVINSIAVIDGVDRFAQQRANLGG